VKDRHVFEIICPKELEDLFKGCTHGLESLGEFQNTMDSLENYDYSFQLSCKLNSTTQDYFKVKTGKLDPIESTKLSFPEGVIKITAFVYKIDEYTVLESEDVEEVVGLNPSQWVDGWSYLSRLTQDDAKELLELYHDINNKRTEAFHKDMDKTFKLNGKKAVLKNGKLVNSSTLSKQDIEDFSTKWSPFYSLAVKQCLDKVDFEKIERS